MLQALMKYARENQRVCPVPHRWNELWKMLPKRQRAGSSWDPSPPPILGDWWSTPILVKRLVLREQLEYAEKHGVLDRVEAFLRGLGEGEWAHESDSKPTGYRDPRE